ncbi:GH13396 [Drosophila grimshawi]|uniref:GH13396 n=2 Tax=Drosophila grimshawi TaxID=7222 RepID=B4JPI0_DROGR|nr:GH13396 [Drosophila grimshawi]
MEPAPEVKDLPKEMNVCLDEEPTNIDAADDDHDKTRFNNLFNSVKELKNTCLKIIESLGQELEDERKKNAELESINKQLREDDKRPTPAQENMEPEPEVEDLLKEMNVCLDEETTNTDAADATELNKMSTNDNLNSLKELNNAHIQTIESLEQILKDERKKHAELENINKQLREYNNRETCSVC